LEVGGWRLIIRVFRPPTSNLYPPTEESLPHTYYPSPVTHHFDA
jgi:hypothetical protein